ncbi:NosR/NirI family protein [Paracoccus sphaerophysae]|uniref:FMN-binding protein n=1 Tax=Paracoccus sphaerophysae TaxID=690417 RepID=A0A099FBM6_9RHOB|nr:NosR/NirI family protein [Paracoccus sphaerophysae]KGJ07638.1 FMN-binding protein [Paracoccus sphaerophysae]
MLLRVLSALILSLTLCLASLMPQQASAQGAAPAASSHLAQLLPDIAPADIVPGADAFGEIRADLPVAPVMGGGQQLGWVYITSDFVGTTGYSGKPIHTAVAVDQDARVLGVRLVKHSEPIVLIGIPNEKIQEMAAGYVGMDLKAEARAGGDAHELNIISGATVTVMVIDDSIVRSGLHVARALGLGGLGEAPAATADAGPAMAVNPDAAAAKDWPTLEGDGTVRRLLLDVATVNQTFETHADPRAREKPLTEAPDTTFIDMRVALVSHPGIGPALLGEAGWKNLQSWLKPGEQAIMVLGNGLYSFKGSGYVRGGIFDRIQLMQGDSSVRFRDRQHRRLNALAAEGAPKFTEMDLFKIPADAGFDPAKPFRLQLLVFRQVAAIDKAFTTYELDYQLPAKYLQEVPQAPAAAPAADAATAQPATAPAPAATGPAATAPTSAAPPEAVMSQAAATEADAQAQLWKRIWEAKTPQIAALLVMLGVLTLAFFFQDYLARSARAVAVFRYAFLTVTLVWLGWMMNAQLSVVNILALFNSLTTGFSWQAFLLDPLTFILWFAVAAALIFWGRGAYCGWLCPFGALQELTNHIARRLGVPQWRLPWGLHERLWPVKYMIFLGLFAVSLMSLDRAEHLAEVEPFKTAIILKFVREWPFVLYAAWLLVMGLFVERFYCRYLCPLGAGLAIPARIRMFDWLKRYRECGNPCQTCGVECMVQAIHPTGQINPNECLNCMHCQVLYHSKEKCPVVQRTLKRRETASASAASLDRILNHPNVKAKGELT